MRAAGARRRRRRRTNRSRRRWGVRRRRGRSSAACTRVRWTVSAGDGLTRVRTCEGDEKDDVGRIFFVLCTGAHQPVPSSEAHSLLHHARQADERALRAVVARHANLMESEGRARGSTRARGRCRASSDGVDKVQKTFVTIFGAKLPAPRVGTGPVYIRAREDAGVGRGKGRRGSPSVAVTARVSSIDQMSICGWVPEGFRPRAEARRRPDPRVVSTCLHYWLPANEGPRRKHGTGARRTWVCLRSRGSPSSSKSSPPAFSFHSDAITIADDARECYRERHLGAKTTEESSSSRARKGMAEKELASTRRRLVSIERGDAYPDASYPSRTLTVLWSITRASRTRRPLRRYGEPRSTRAPLRGPI